MNMSQPEHYEDLVLGSGAGGKLLAWHLARSGRRVAVVERRWIGGFCPNIKFLPNKKEIWGAKVVDLVRHAARFGVVTVLSRLTWPRCASVSARWWRGWSLCTWTCTKRVAP